MSKEASRAPEDTYLPTSTTNKENNKMRNTATVLQLLYYVNKTDNVGTRGVSIACRLNQQIGYIQAELFDTNGCFSIEKSGTGAWSIRYKENGNVIYETDDIDQYLQDGHRRPMFLRNSGGFLNITCARRVTENFCVHALLNSMGIHRHSTGVNIVTFGQSMVSLIFTPAGPTGVSRKRSGDDEDAATQKRPRHHSDH